MTVQNRKMLSATTFLLACTSMVSSGGNKSVASAASAKSERIKHNRRPNNMSHIQLPQHRIRRPERIVPYPEYHPLSRHLRTNDEEDGETIKSNHLNTGNKIEEQTHHHHHQRRTERRRRRPFTNYEENDESIIKDKVLLDNTGEFLHYWTITGRNLITSSTSFTEGGISDSFTNQNKDEIGDESAKLLMDVDQLTSLNSSSGNNSGGEGSSLVEGEYEYEHENNDALPTEVTLAYNHDPSITESSESHSDTSTIIDPVVSSVIESLETAAAESTTTSTEQTSIYQPIRLRAIFTDDQTSGFQYLTDSQRTILMEQIVNPALFAWSKALSVVPVGNGEEDHDGKGGTTNDFLVVDKTQLYDGESCGPGLDSGYPSVRVPLEHMTDGIPETDTVIYISVSFLDPIMNRTSGGGGGGGDDEADSLFSTSATLPSLNHLHRSASMIRNGDSSLEYNNATEEELIFGVESTDAPSSLPPTASPSFPPSETEPNVDTRPLCPGTYVASATHCSTDQYDRPVAGILSLCIKDVHQFFYNEEAIQRNSMTAMHEIAHILGFNALSLAHFRDKDTGEPLTPRDENGNVPDVEVECTGIAPTTKSMVPLPSEDIVKFQNVRGGVRAATIVTPTVRRVTRNMFGCQSLLGAELQSGEGQGIYVPHDDAANSDIFQLSPGECIGDHWQRLLFRKDLMNPVIDDVPHSLYISSLTLAYFKDSGWYDVDYDRIAAVSMWGRNAGCNFARKTCITSSGHVQASNIPFFCSNLATEEEEEGDEVREPEIHGCDVESSRKAVCSLGQYDEDVVPPEFNYFSRAKSFPEGVYGGSDPTLDFCPVFVGYANGRCDDKDAEEYAGVSSFEVFGEDNSRCVMGHVEKRRTSLCLPIACVIQDHSLRIKVDGYWKMCDYSGQVISMWWNPNNYVVCPDPARMCPSFYCPHDCLDEEGGVCDYEQGQCMCEEETSLQSGSNTTNWLSLAYNKNVLVPCSGGKDPAEVNETFAINPEVERIDLELPEYYVENATILLDEPKVFEDKVSRMFSQLSSGDIMGLIASFVVVVLLSMFVSTQAVKCYKRKVIRTSIKQARSRMRSLPDVMRNMSRLPNGNESGNSFDESDSRSSFDDRRPPGGNPQKDKMVANLLLQNRLELGNIATSETIEDDNNEGKKSFAPTIANLSSTSLDQIVVNRSELPPLEEGRVLAVVENEGRVLAVVDDEYQNENRYARSSATSVTRDSEFTSPLYQEQDEEEGSRSMLRLRLRRNNII